MSRPVRRLITCMLGLIAAIALPVGSAAAATPAALTEAQAQQVGTDAYVYGVSLMEFLRQRQQQTSVTVPNTLSDAPINQLGNARALATPAHQVFVAPNLDTLYSMGHVDLAKGALVLHVPAVSGGRYYSFEFLDPYTNVFHYVGTRTTGNGAGNYVIVGPTFHGTLPVGLHRISSKYEHIWLVGRTQVYGPSDIPAVHKVQNGYKLIPLTKFETVGLGYTPPRPHRIIMTHTVATLPTGLAYFDALGTALAQNPAPARDASILAELKTVGIGPGMHPSTENLPAATLAGVQAAAAAGPTKVFTDRISIAVASARVHHGWYVAPSDIGNFGTDYALRAVIAGYGIAANLRVEAMYPVASADSTGNLLNGANKYVIHFAAGHLPPARYFWSLTMYNAQNYLVANPINRYALGSHSAGLQYNADGSLDIYIQSTPPAGHQSNWLPCPPLGQIVPIMRMYGPKAPALNDTYTYPSITKVG
jgi:hypothetical protein